MAKRTRRKTEDEIASVVSRQIDEAKSYYGADREAHREWALRFFEGEVDIKPMGDHRSQIVSRDVSDTHGLILPGLMRIFFASSRIVDYEPTQPEHEEYADLASDYVNYVVMSECEGYKHFRSAMSDGVLMGNGIIKHWWDASPEYTTDTYTAMAEDAYQLIVSELGEDDEIIDEESRDDPDFEMPSEEDIIAFATAQGLDPSLLDPAVLMAQLPPPPKVYDFKVKRLTAKGRLRVMAVPPEEFWLERSATVLDESARFCAHVQRKTRSELKAAGYDKAKVDAIPLSTDVDRDSDRLARDRDDWQTELAPDAATERVDIYECYVLMDTDGDGIAERRRIVMGGQSGKRAILANEEWGDDLPFSDIVPDPVAHRWRGRGIYDLMGDVQRVNTVLTRGVLDNLYKVLVPQRYAWLGSVENPDELMNPTFGGTVWLKSGTQTPPMDVQTNFLAPQILPVIEYMNSVGEKRTGVSMRSQSMDLDALQNQSATAVNAAQAAAQTKVEEYARNIAECGGMRRIFSCILRLITKHQDRSKMVRLAGKFVEIDPTQWRNPDMNVTINTGLGTGSRDRDLAMLSSIAAKQEQVIGQFGPLNDDLNVGHLFGTYSKMAEAAGVKNPDQFFPPITQERIAELKAQQGQAPQQPDPKAAEAQAKLQMRQQELEFEQKISVARFQAEQQASAAKMQFDTETKRVQMAIDAEGRRVEAELKLQTMREEAAAKLELLHQETSARIQIAREEAAMKQDARMREMDIEAQLREIQMAIGANNQSAANIPRPE
jgi:hypothetical protein